MPRKWEPSSNDAMSLAAFRWLANRIENDAMALYATEPGCYREIENVLRRTLHELKHLKRDYAVPLEENGCPDGWVLCDGVCQPSCESIEEASSASAQSVE